MAQTNSIQTMLNFKLRSCYATYEKKSGRELYNKNLLSLLNNASKTGRNTEVADTLLCYPLILLKSEN